MDIEKLSPEVVYEGGSAYMIAMVIQPIMIERIKEAQDKDPKFIELKHRSHNGEARYFYVIRDEILKHKDHLCIRDDEMLKRELMEEGRHSLYIMHSGNNKMY